MSSADAPDVTQLLTHARNGDVRAADLLLPLVYDELRRLAEARLNQERPGQTLQATALVHEAYLRLVPQNDAHFNDRAHFFRVAALSIRRILAERARPQSRKRRVNLDETATLCAESDAGSDVDYEAVHRCLVKFAKFDPVGEQIVNLRFFAGLEMDQVADALGVPKRTAERRWQDAKAWLKREMNDG